LFDRSCADPIDRSSFQYQILVPAFQMRLAVLNGLSALGLVLDSCRNDGTETEGRDF
jgi:hypothetical protein